MKPGGSPIIEWAVCTDVGRRRTNNEDSWGAHALGGAVAVVEPGRVAVREAGLLFTVSDGMGGARGGEVASKFCVEELPVRVGRGLKSGGPGSVLEEAIQQVHHELAARGEAQAELRGMGATLTALWFRPDGAAIIGHVGDSRAYRWRRGSWMQLTDDHSVGAGMVRRGEMTAEVARRLRFRSLLEQAMGADGGPIQPQLRTEPSEAGDTWLLCSDGLHGPLGDDLAELAERALRAGSLAPAAEQLVAAANATGGPDNITVLLARVVPGGRA